MKGFTIVNVSTEQINWALSPTLTKHPCCSRDGAIKLITISAYQLITKRDLTRFLCKFAFSRLAAALGWSDPTNRSVLQAAVINTPFKGRLSRPARASLCKAALNSLKLAPGDSSFQGIKELRPPRSSSPRSPLSHGPQSAASSQFSQHFQVW